MQNFRLHIVAAFDADKQAFALPLVPPVCSQSPVAAYAGNAGDTVVMRAVSFRDAAMVQRGEAKRPIAEVAVLGGEMAARLK